MNEKIFYTDSNGFFTEKRERGHFNFSDYNYERDQSKIGSNFYPITTFLYIEDYKNSSKRMTVFNDRT